MLSSPSQERPSGDSEKQATSKGLVSTCSPPADVRRKCLFCSSSDLHPQVTPNQEPSCAYDIPQSGGSFLTGQPEWSAGMWGGGGMEPRGREGGQRGDRDCPETRRCSLAHLPRVESSWKGTRTNCSDGPQAQCHTPQAFDTPPDSNLVCSLWPPTAAQSPSARPPHSPDSSSTTAAHKPAAFRVPLCPLDSVGWSSSFGSLNKCVCLLPAPPATDKCHDLQSSLLANRPHLPLF